MTGVWIRLEAGMRRFRMLTGKRLLGHGLSRGLRTLLASLAAFAFLSCQFSGFANASVGAPSDGDVMMSCESMGASDGGAHHHHKAPGGEKAPLSKMVKAGCNCFCAVILPSAPVLMGHAAGAIPSLVAERSDSRQVAPPNRPPRRL